MWYLCVGNHIYWNIKKLGVIGCLFENWKMNIVTMSLLLKYFTYFQAIKNPIQDVIILFITWPRGGDSFRSLHGVFVTLLSLMTQAKEPRWGYVCFNYSSEAWEVGHWICLWTQWTTMNKNKIRAPFGCNGRCCCNTSFNVNLYRWVHRPPYFPWSMINLVKGSASLWRRMREIITINTCHAVLAFFLQETDPLF